MKYYHALKNSAYNFRIDLCKLGFIFSLVAIGYVSSISNTPCLEAQSTCAVGSNPVFSENINIKGGTAFQTTIDGSNITADRTLTLADTDMDLSNALVATGALTNNTPLKIDSGGNVVTQDLVPETDLTIGSGTAGQMLAVNSGGTALEFANTYSPPVLTASKVMATDGAGAFSTTDVYPLSLTALKVIATDATGALTITDVYPLSLTANKPLVSDGTGALTTASLTADKIMVTDTNGNLDTTNVYPLSFSANKPIVSDVSGNLTDITLTGDTPMKTDANGNLTATDLVPETDLTIGSGTASQFLAVNSGATALEFVDAPTGGQWTLVASGEGIQPTNSYQNSTGDDVLFCWGGANSTDGVDGSYFRMSAGKRYKLVFSTKTNHGQMTAATSGNSNHGMRWLDSQVDCSNGSISKVSGNSWPTNYGWGFISPSWYLKSSSNGNSANYGSGTSMNYQSVNHYCEFFASQTAVGSNMPVSWSGELTIQDFEATFNGSNYGIQSEWDVEFRSIDSSSPWDAKEGGFSKGDCFKNKNGSQQSNYNTLSSVSSVYGLFLNSLNYNFGGNKADYLVYWLYEDNNFCSKWGGNC